MNRVLVLATTFPRWKQDTEPPFVYELSKRLAKRRKVTVLVPQAPGALSHEKWDSLEIKRFTYFFPRSAQKLCYGGGIRENMKRSLLARIQLPFLLLAELLATFMILLFERVSIIHAHWILPQGIVALICKQLLGVHYVLTAHAGDVFPLKSGVLKFFAKLALQNALVVTANSEATATAIRKIYPTSRPIIIPMGVDLSIFKPRGKKSKNVLAVGRMVEKKGFGYLIRAMPIVEKKVPGVKLIIAGTGPLEEDLKRISKKLHANVRFTGALPNKKLRFLYASASVFAMPSIVDRTGDTEGLGVTAIEAMASGTAVVASDVAGLKSFIQNGENGLMVRQGDIDALARAIIRLFTDTRLRNNLELAGRETAKEKFDWDIISAKFNKVLATL